MKSFAVADAAATRACKSGKIKVIRPRDMKNNSTELSALSILEASAAGAGGASFTLANRLYRAAFAIAWTLLARWTLPQWHGWRRLLLRAFGARIGHAAIYPSVEIWSPTNLVVGYGACIGPRAKIYAMARITIEPHALISQGAHLCAGSHDIDDPNFQLLAAPIRVGERAWIAAEAFVGPGVTVGAGAVLGARGCAFADLAPWTVYIGNPARPSKSRAIRALDSRPVDGGGLERGQKPQYFQDFATPLPNPRPQGEGTRDDCE